MSNVIRWDTDQVRLTPPHSLCRLTDKFDARIGSFDLLHGLRDSRQALNPLSLYLHLPFCANACYFCHCQKIVTKDRGRTLPYLERLEQEIRLTSCHLDPRQHVERLQLGGGTPTFLSHDQLRRLMHCLRQHFTLLDDDSCDYGIEIDPREADWSTMGLLRELGFNRISIGIQDLDPEVQRATNRLQTLGQTRAILDAARTLQFRSVNLDLMYGLPKQTPERFAHTLSSLLALQPDRLTLRHYQHQPQRFPNQGRIATADLPCADEQWTIYQRSLELLCAAGYRDLGLGQFALPDDDLSTAQEDGLLQRNFQGHTTHGHCDLIGLGLSAISQIGDLYCQNSGDLEQYQGSLENGQLPTVRGWRAGQPRALQRVRSSSGPGSH
jgi:oxygen-independent coproporphyrinogen-3 oxidase